MKILIPVLALVLTGCATHVVSSSQRSVVVESQSLDTEAAQKLADAECGKYRKYARMSVKGGYWERNYVFDCID